MKTKSTRLVASLLCIVVVFTASFTGCTKKTDKKPILTTEPVTENVTEITTEEASTEPVIPQLPEDDNEFVKISEYAPDIKIDLRYSTENNFTGKVIYEFKEPYIRCGTLRKLIAINEELAEQGLALCIWDAYRPADAQSTLFNATPPHLQYTYVSDSATGNHCKGHTVDVTLYSLEKKEILEMPSEFDEFSEKAWPGLLADDTAAARENVKILIDAMTKENRFSTIDSEWWHFVDTDSYETSDFDPAKHEEAEAIRKESMSMISQELEDAMVLQRDTYPAE